MYKNCGSLFSPSSKVKKKVQPKYDFDRQVVSTYLESDKEEQGIWLILKRIVYSIYKEENKETKDMMSK